MAKKTITQLVDDIDGSIMDDDSGETITFAVNGVEYVIDLKAKNAVEFYKKFDYYTGYATRVGGHKRKPSPTTTTPPTVGAASIKRDPAQTRAIRQWAFDQGYEISDRGRIPANIEEAFNASH